MVEYVVQDLLVAHTDVVVVPRTPVAKVSVFFSFSPLCLPQPHRQTVIVCLFVSVLFSTSICHSVSVFLPVSLAFLII